jgi:predicted Zn-dependent protease
VVTEEPARGDTAEGPAESSLDDGVAVDAASAEPVRYEDAEAAYFAGDRARAAELFERYTARKPDNAWGHYMLGLSRWKTGDLTGAEEAFQAALAIAPAHEKSLVNLSRTLLDDGRAADALPIITRAVEAEAPSVDAHRVHGRVLHTLGRTEEALAAYAEALAIDPEDAWSLNNAGLVLIEAERFEEAANYLARACDADSSEAVFRNNLGIARERLGDYGAAETEFAQALELDGSYDKARVSLARVAELADAVAPADPAPTPDDVELAASAEPAGPESPPEE